MYEYDPDPPVGVISIHPSFPLKQLISKPSPFVDLTTESGSPFPSLSSPNDNSSGSSIVIDSVLLWQPN